MGVEGELSALVSLFERARVPYTARVNAPAAIAARLGAQQIDRHDFERPEEIVAWLGAVQAQDALAAKWAVGIRLSEGRVIEADIDRAITEGRLVRTHAMRETWQLIAREDLRWILSLVGPRLIAGGAGRRRQLGLDAAMLKKCRAAIAKAIEREGHRTRDELKAVLAKLRLPAEGSPFAHVLGHLELDALICSGAPRGTRATYALVDERVPSARAMAREDALLKLGERYFRSRGPATASDFAWWAGVTLADARHVLANVAPASDARGPRVKKTSTHLLPAFDEYLVGYRDRDAVLDRAHVKRFNAGGGMLSPVIVSGGRVVGTWRRALVRDTVKVELEYFTSARPDSRALARALERYATFLGRTLKNVDKETI